MGYIGINIIKCFPDLDLNCTRAIKEIKRRQMKKKLYITVIIVTCNIVISPKLMWWFNLIPPKIPIVFLVKINKMIQKCTWKWKWTSTYNTVLKRWIVILCCRLWRTIPVSLNAFSKIRGLPSLGTTLSEAKWRWLFLLVLEGPPHRLRPQP